MLNDNGRRSFMKLLAAAPLFAAIESRSLASTVATAAGKASSADVYTRLGVRPFINARGTWTYLSGSLELPEVRRSGRGCVPAFCRHVRTAARSRTRLAELSGAESGMVTSGSAGAMAAATAACIAGSDPNNVWQLPDTKGLKHEVVMLGGRSAFDSAIRLAGGKLVLAHGVDDLQCGHQPANRHGLHHVARRPPGESTYHHARGRSSHAAGRCSGHSPV